MNPNKNSKKENVNTNNPLLLLEPIDNNTVDIINRASGSHQGGPVPTTREAIRTTAATGTATSNEEEDDLRNTSTSSSLFSFSLSSSDSSSSGGSSSTPCSSASLPVTEDHDLPSCFPLLSSLDSSCIHSTDTNTSIISSSSSSSSSNSNGNHRHSSFDAARLAYLREKRNQRVLSETNKNGILLNTRNSIHTIPTTHKDTISARKKNSIPSTSYSRSSSTHSTNRNHKSLAHSYSFPLSSSDRISSSSSSSSSSSALLKNFHPKTIRALQEKALSIEAAKKKNTGVGIDITTRMNSIRPSMLSPSCRTSTTPTSSCSKEGMLLVSPTSSTSTSSSSSSSSTSTTHFHSSTSFLSYFRNRKSSKQDTSTYRENSTTTTLLQSPYGPGTPNHGSAFPTEEGDDTLLLLYPRKLYDNPHTHPLQEEQQQLQTKKSLFSTTASILTLRNLRSLVMWSLVLLLLLFQAVLLKLNYTNNNSFSYYDPREVQLPKIPRNYNFTPLLFFVEPTMSLLPNRIAYDDYNDIVNIPNHAPFFHYHNNNNNNKDTVEIMSMLLSMPITTTTSTTTTTAAFAAASSRSTFAKPNEWNPNDYENTNNVPSRKERKTSPHSNKDDILRKRSTILVSNSDPSSTTVIRTSTSTQSTSNNHHSPSTNPIENKDITQHNHHPQQQQQRQAVNEQQQQQHVDGARKIEQNKDTEKDYPPQKHRQLYHPTETQQIQQIINHENTNHNQPKQQQQQEVVIQYKNISDDENKESNTNKDSNSIHGNKKRFKKTVTTTTKNDDNDNYDNSPTTEDYHNSIHDGDKEYNNQHLYPSSGIDDLDNDTNRKIKNSIFKKLKIHKIFPFLKKADTSNSSSSSSSISMNDKKKKKNDGHRSKKDDSKSSGKKRIFPFLP